MEPVRTCIACRARAPRSSLLRVVLQDSHLVADAAAVRPGRGAWLHPTRECFLLADRRRAFGRALRFTGSLDTSDVQNRLNG
ncbi:MULTISPECIES: YlxR family protein [Agromyces]|uniref:YlxR family protein n=1 Tax=Agromyces TaxID=33877 RepID=UPI0016668134|nr:MULTISPECIES: YlxR family protein [Agromyces]MCD1573096.1 YlxR family protein [Agromyces mediolanus]